MRKQKRRDQPDKSRDSFKPQPNQKTNQSSTSATITGRVKRNQDGFGFLIPDDRTHFDVYLPRHTMAGVMTDDIVEVRPKREREDRFSGEVIKIIKHAMTTTVGRYKHQPIDGSGLIIDESKGWGENIKIARENNGSAREGDLVALEILTFPGDKKGFTAKVIEVMGKYGDPLHDSKQVIYESHIPLEFSKLALEITEKLPSEVRESDWRGRKDLRLKKFVTIDGATARDFDDAVYAEKESDGFRVWVAIADVSHYVAEGNALDKDAYERGTSVYFPDMVVPMLPEKLSNGLCSLNPQLDRLAMVAEMKLNSECKVTSTDIYEVVFKSHHRLIYGEVEDMINGHPNSKFENVAGELSLLRDIAKILMRNRFLAGSLDLEIPEAQLVIDAAGVPTDVIRGERLFAHRLIEELMLLANVEVAKFIERHHEPSLYRIHEEPFPNSLKALEIMAHNWGVKVRFEMKAGNANIQKNLMKLLKHVEGKPEANILSMLILRSMKQAQYSSQNLGHFGLAFSTYTHFTSPIRRYPDLVVHRVLKKIISKRQTSEKNQEEATNHMAGMGTFLSACEQRATKAERELKSIKRCRFMQRHVGEEFEGMITGVVKFGIFVQLRAYDIDGLVKLETLHGDRFEYDDEKQKLIGRKTGTVISLGDMVKVRVTRADPEKREIDFEWIDQPHAATNNGKTIRTDNQERGETSPHSGGARNPRVSKRSGAGKAGPVHSKKNNKNRRNRKAKRG
jgi:ribonuclease R